VGAKEGDRPLHEADDGLRALVSVKLGVGEPGVVVDDRVGELIAHPLALLGA
jgi:hypothetical protein